MKAGASGTTLLEVLVAVALVGALTVMTAPLMTYFLRHSSVENVDTDEFTLGFSLVPQLREDVRRAVRAGRELEGLQGGKRGLALDFGDAAGLRGVVYRIDGGMIQRVPFAEVEGKLVAGRARVWRGDFEARFGYASPLVGLEVDGAGKGGSKLLSFRFRLRG